MELSSNCRRNSQFADYYVWEHPSRALTICLNAEAMDSLQHAIFASIDHFGRGYEIDGILLGTREEQQGHKTVIVTRHNPLASPKPGTSPSAPQDATHFADALQRFKSSAEDRTVSIVGFYRSHNRNGLYLCDDDLELIKTHFQDHDAILMLIKTLPMRACTAGFFFWGADGRIQTEFPTGEIPLSPAELPTRARFDLTTHEPSSIALTVSTTLPDTHSAPEMQYSEAAQSASSPVPQKRGNWRLWLLSLYAAAVLAVIGIMMTASVFRKSMPEQVPLPSSFLAAPAPLNLDVKQTAIGHVELSWDRERPEIIAAQSGVLIIRDGADRQRLTLTREQVRSGAVAYAPNSGDMDFRLELYRNGLLSWFDSLRVLITETSGNAMRTAAH
jgi:proteasome lid subunit RPN8/RPN11